MNAFRVVNKKVATQLNIKEDNYLARLVKYIPAEIVAAYTAMRAIALGDSSGQIPLPEIVGASPRLFLLIFVGCLVLTPLYQYQIMRDDKLPPPTYQIAVSTLAFIVWVFAFGDIFSYWLADYDSRLAGILLIFFTLITPLVDKVVEKYKSILR